jgi:hypothetical protein
LGFYYLECERYQGVNICVVICEGDRERREKKIQMLLARKDILRKKKREREGERDQIGRALCR